MKKDFTRNRKLTFPITIVFMLNFLTKSLSSEIVNFVDCLKSKCNHIIENGFTKSAFTQARKKIKAEGFLSLSQLIVDEYYKVEQGDNSIKKWKGHRLLAVDGSQVTLPNTQELYEKFGSPSNQHGEVNGLVQARASVLYDVLNHYILDSILSPLSEGERKHAVSHLAYASPADIVIYDRGYPSFDLIYEHEKRQIDFVIRAKVSFNNQVKSFVKSKSVSKTVELKPSTKSSFDGYGKDKRIRVRLVKVKLDDGEIEVLITSLLDEKKYPTKIFKDLYFKRWGVETLYDELKNKIKLENFSGYSYNSIMQDFYIAIFTSNIQTLIVGDLEGKLDKKSDKKYRYKINTSLSYGFMKDRVLELYFSEKEPENIVKELEDLFVKHLVPVRPNRSFPREKNKYRRKKKPIVPKNRKDSF